MLTTARLIGQHVKGQAASRPGIIAGFSSGEGAQAAFDAALNRGREAVDVLDTRKAEEEFSVALDALRALPVEERGSHYASLVEGMMQMAGDVTPDHIPVVWNNTLEIAREGLAVMQEEEPSEDRALLFDRAGMLCDLLDSEDVGADLRDLSLQEYEKLGLTKSLGYARVFHHKGIALAGREDWKRANEAFSYASEIMTELDLTSTVYWGKVRTSIAFVQAQSGELREALSTYSEAAKVYSSLGAKGPLMNTLAVMGMILGTENRDLALKCVDDSLAIWSSLGEPPHHLIQTLLSEAAILAAAHGDLDAASDRCNLSISKAEELYGPHSKQALEAMNLRGTILHGSNKVDEAIAAYQEVLDILDKEGRRESLEGVNSLHLLASSVAHGRGDLANSLKLWNEALELLQQVGDADPSINVDAEMADILDKSAKLIRHLDLTMSIERMQSAFEVAENSLMAPDQFQQAGRLSWIAMALKDDQQLPEAIETLEKVIVLGDELGMTGTASLEPVVAALNDMKQQLSQQETI